MKIFNRGTESAKPAQAPAAPPAVGPAAASAQPEAPPPPPAPPAPDLSAILDANVKEMSEKIARLASTVESQGSDRASFEAKLEQMDERMRKLSSLTEMISAQFNPFVGDAPLERDPPPSPEVGLAPPVAAPMLAPELPGASSLMLGGALPFAADDADAPAAVPGLPALEAPLPEPDEADAPEVGHAQVWSVPPGFQGSLILLSWADMLLKTTGSRENLLEVVNYYHNIGWIGDPARDQLLAYADGISSPPAQTGQQEWRASFEVHEKSLLYVEKLKSLVARRSG